MGPFCVPRIISVWLREFPWRANVCIGTAMGFSADVITQILENKPRLEKDHPPGQCGSSLVVKCPVFLHRLLMRAKNEKDVPIPVIDLRRSLIFCSFTVVFNTFFFLSLYKKLDRLIPPRNITRCQAILKGFLSWIGANATTPLYVSYVATLSHYFIHHTGRYRVCSNEGDEFELSMDFPFFREAVTGQINRQLRVDWPDMAKYSLLFWGVNWIPMFYYIPPHFRYVYSSFLQIAWCSIMSHLMHRGAKSI